VDVGHVDLAVEDVSPRGEVRFTPLGHLRTREVGEVLERASLRMRK
jgi:hypothetical protein